MAGLFDTGIYQKLIPFHSNIFTTPYLKKKFFSKAIDLRNDERVVFFSIK